jgi:hypothetical protein
VRGNQVKYRNLLIVSIILICILLALGLFAVPLNDKNNDTKVKYYFDNNNLNGYQSIIEIEYFRDKAIIFFVDNECNLLANIYEQSNNDIWVFNGQLNGIDGICNTDVSARGRLLFIGRQKGYENLPAVIFGYSEHKNIKKIVINNKDLKNSTKAKILQMGNDMVLWYRIVPNIEVTKGQFEIKVITKEGVHLYNTFD